jgi:hypothetical protein
VATMSHPGRQRRSGICWRQLCGRSRLTRWRDGRDDNLPACLPLQNAPNLAHIRAGAQDVLAHDRQMIRHQHAILAAIGDDQRVQRGGLGNVLLHAVPDAAQIARGNHIGKVLARCLKQAMVGKHLA